MFRLSHASKFEDMDCIIDASSGMGAIYLGNLDAASDPLLLKKHKIRAVLTVAGGTGLSYRRDIVPNHEVIPADDIETYDLTQWFEFAVTFIEEQRQQGNNVLVHCFAGISRSATIIIAYLMSKYKWSYESTAKFVRDRRPQINPNSGFVDQLRLLDRIMCAGMQEESRPSSKRLSLSKSKSKLTSPAPAYASFTSARRSIFH
eukprot:TRINITY_DN6924_c0_g1_i4.p1 TRINITY_DN6924_c0_g1~~TRINITY_DN6924_c0_g1_i4.p1  ORF type:complete len:203 (-),score=16.70 TRINITY_DN6924_c0_g1_i4:197-805(-)